MSNFNEYTDQAIRDIEKYKDNKNFQEKYKQVFNESSKKQEIVKRSQKPNFKLNKPVIIISLVAILAAGSKLKSNINKSQTFDNSSIQPKNKQELLIDNENVMDTEDLIRKTQINSMSIEEAAIHFGFSGFMESLIDKGYDMPMIYGFFINNGYDYRTRDGELDMDKAYEHWFSDINVEKSKGGK